MQSGSWKLSKAGLYWSGSCFAHKPVSNVEVGGFAGAVYKTRRTLTPMAHPKGRRSPRFCSILYCFRAKIPHFSSSIPRRSPPNSRSFLPPSPSLRRRCMEPSENLSEMKAAEVPEDPSITLARKISSATRQNHRVKARAAKKEKIKKRLAAGGPGGGVGCGGHGGRHQIGAPIVQTHAVAGKLQASILLRRQAAQNPRRYGALHHRC